MRGPEIDLKQQLFEAGNRLLKPLGSVNSDQSRVEKCLSYVEQQPPVEMQDALCPAFKALVINELLKHADIDVQVGVTACLTEISRITAPDVPYSDELMKMKTPTIDSLFFVCHPLPKFLDPSLHKTQIESSPMPCFKSKLDRCGSTVSFVDTYTDSLDSDLYSSESEVDDPDEAEVVDHMVANQEMVKLREEIERLRIENQIQQAELVQKDEEKREVIRQLSLAVDMMKEENLILRKSLAAASTDQVSATSKKWSIPEFRKVFFFGI